MASIRDSVLVVRPETPPLWTPEGGERRTRVFYSKNGWDPFLQSGLGTAGPTEPHSSSPNGSQEIPPVFVRGHRPDSIGASPDSECTFHTFLSQGIPSNGTMCEVGTISGSARVDLPW